MIFCINPRESPKGSCRSRTLGPLENLQGRPRIASRGITVCTTVFISETSILAGSS